jgi:hypothetical protein
MNILTRLISDIHSDFAGEISSFCWLDSNGLSARSPLILDLSDVIRLWINTPKNTSKIRLQKNEHQKTCSSPHRLGVHFGYMSGTRRLELRFWTWMRRPWSIWPLPALGPERGNGGWLVGGGSEILVGYDLVWFSPNKNENYGDQIFCGYGYSPKYFSEIWRRSFGEHDRKAMIGTRTMAIKKLGNWMNMRFLIRGWWGGAYFQTMPCGLRWEMGEVLPPWMMCLASNVGTQCQKLSQIHKASPNGRFIGFTTLVVL